MFIKRKLGLKLAVLKTQFPIIGLMGPRQSGKTTLAKEAFPEHRYVNLEDLDIRRFAKEDPRGFLDAYEGGEGVILDEIQNVPELFSYLQTRVDLRPKAGFYILTGSQNILLNQHISQTLAGRISIQTLLPLSIDELSQVGFLPADPLALLFQGFYPAIYAKKIDPLDWYKSYLQTYVERDVRQMRNIPDLSLFQKFLKLCAGRIGQLLNLSSLSNDCGISVNTARSWISILEASYILFLLTPYHKNFNKRLIKAPKLYFCDVGLAAQLLDIESSEMLTQHYLRGGLFESMVVMNLLKARLNAGKNPHLYFWRDKTGLEIDCLIEKGDQLVPIEMKSAKTFHPDFFDGLLQFCKLSGVDLTSSYVVYGGEETQKRQEGTLLSWKDLSFLER